MKQVVLTNKGIAIEEVPEPIAQPGMVVVKTEFSCISAGTEMKSYHNSRKPLLKRALENPDLVKKVIKRSKQTGYLETSRFIQKRLSTGIALGYSAAGRVIDTGEGVKRFRVGDLVACAGAGYANHAEVISAPENLTVQIPNGLSTKFASTVTLGSIALQGVRRLNPTLGETFVVIGLGILGQLTVQLLKANGCRVIGFDLLRDRVALAEKCGMDFGLKEDSEDHIKEVLQYTDGLGADGVVITAASRSHEILSTAFRMCRKKGRVVLVGDVGLHIKREDIYKKELDFFVSTSYGPGRYDERYEEKGYDYPVAYVRWTENRNMAEYLRLVNIGKINLEHLITEVFPIDDVRVAYAKLKSDHSSYLIVLLQYHEGKNSSTKRSFVYWNASTKADGNSQKVRLAIIGAGSFIKGMHLPNIKKMGDIFELRAVISRNGLNAKITSEQYGAAYSGTDFQTVLDDSEVDAVLIGTRHYLHAPMTLKALKAGKHVFVEKPLALNMEQMKPIMDFYQNSSNKPILFTGFNRRFSPIMGLIKQIVAKRVDPMIVNYRMNAGYIPLDHWVHGAEGGGRNIGEACHIYDLFTFLTGGKVKDVEVSCIIPKTEHFSNRDNFVATISFDDGSVATLTYCAMGNAKYPKEHLEIYVDGGVIAVSDYKTCKCYGIRKRPIRERKIDKGHKNELEMFGKAVLNHSSPPIPIWEQFQAMEISFMVEEHLIGRKGYSRIR